MEKYITQTKIIHAPRKRVWEAWIDQTQLAKWWAPDGFTNPICEVNAKVGGELYILMQADDDMGAYSNMKAPMKGVFTEVIENEKLVFTNIALDENGNHLLEGVTTVTFEDEDDKTKLIVHTGAKGTTQGVEQMLNGMEPGWKQQLDKLDVFIENN
jgi:uncharacterized protein YndB with AHSA1/START domain